MHFRLTMLMLGFTSTTIVNAADEPIRYVSIWVYKHLSDKALGLCHRLLGKIAPQITPIP